MSTIKAFVGLGITAISILMLIGSGISLFGITALTFIGFNLPSCIVALAVLDIILGLIGLYFGSRMFFKNEDKFTKSLFGIFGLLVILIGAIVAIGGSEAIVPIFIGLLIISIGLSFIAYAWNIKALNTFGKLLKMYRGVVV
jgi:hypothetical protein